MELAERIRRVQQGDKAALNDVIRVYGGSVYQRALRKTGNREKAQAVTRRMISEMVEAINLHPDADGYDLWIWTLQDKCLDAVDGGEFDAPPEAGEVPVYTSTPRPAAPAVSDENSLAAAYPQQAEPRQNPRHAEMQYAHRQESPAEAAPSARQPSGGRHAAKRKAKRDAKAQVSLDEFENRGGKSLGVFMLIALCLVLTWFAVGLMMRLGFVPAVDLGYVWFNNNIYMLF